MLKPTVDSSVFVAPGAVLRGDVTVNKNANIWYNAVLRGDTAPIVIGECSNVQDGCVLHVDKDCPLHIGNYVTVGHGAILHGCTIEDEVLVGMGATVLNGAVIGEGSIIGAGALVKAGMIVPENSLLVGCPAKIIREVTPEQRAASKQNALDYVKEAEEYKSLEA